MTKNRKHKRAIRTVKAVTGANYTTVMRAMSAESDRTVRVGLGHGDDSFLVRLGENVDGSPAVLDLGADGVSGPVTWVGGRAGSGKSTVANQIAIAFMDRNPTGRVVWVDPEGRGPVFWPVDINPPCLQVGLRDQDAAVALAQATETAAGQVPTLVVVDEIAALLDPQADEGQGGPDFGSVLHVLARQGRSRGVRLLVTSQVPPPLADPSMVLPWATQACVWVGVPGPATWETFFGPRSADWVPEEGPVPAPGGARAGCVQDYPFGPLRSVWFPRSRG